MAVREGIDPGLAEWITAQPLFFVASAPLSAEGHVNLSPRGLDSFRVLGAHEVAYLDLTGSGNETAAHLAENGRITVMFCAFSGDPKILRLYGRGRVVLPRDADWDALRTRFPAELPAERQIVHVRVTRVQTSCGFGVPLLEYRGQRTMIHEWALRKGPKGLIEYRHRKNRRSLDGLPAPGLEEP
jgi:hypothetical protein